MDFPRINISLICKIIERFARHVEKLRVTSLQVVEVKLFIFIFFNTSSFYNFAILR